MGAGFPSRHGGFGVDGIHHQNPHTQRSRSASEGADPTQLGIYLNLVQQQDDGSWQIHWGVSNYFPPAEG